MIVSKLFLLIIIEDSINNVSNYKKEINITDKEGRIGKSESDRNSLFSRRYTKSAKSIEKASETSQSTSFIFYKLILLGIKGCFLLNNYEGRYYGTKIDGKKEGIGKITWSNGSYFKGCFKINKANGLGKYVDSIGCAFVGKIMISDIMFRRIHRK